MEKVRSSPLSRLFPWLAPLVITFAVVNGGIEAQLSRNNRLREKWHPSELRRVLPAELTKWIEDHHIYQYPQPYPLARQLWQYLIPHASKKLIIDSSALAKLEEVGQPQKFALVWTLNAPLERIEGHFTGADRYLGMGWFQKDTQIWSLKTYSSPTMDFPAAVDFQLRNLIVSLQQADSLLNSIIPSLQAYVPTRAAFQLITDFAVQVIVSDARSGGLILKLQCNYPQLLSTMQVPQQRVDVLLANQAIIQFPQQAQTPVLIQLLQSRSLLTIQGAGVPFFISEQLPIMRQYRQISEEMAAKITQANPIVSIAALKTTFTLTHRYENGVGKYSMTATYHYQQHTLDMDALLAAFQWNRRFVQQHGIWFEWPHNAHNLASTILQQLATHVLLPEEVMGFDTRRTALLAQPMVFPTIQPAGATPFARGKSLCERLRQHGIPGGIFGEPKGFRAMFVDACEHVVRDNRQARILWLVPSNKKGSATNSLKLSTISQYVTVASPVTLRDEPDLFLRSWTLVIFQELDHLLDGGMQSRMLSRLKWQWALTSVTSAYALLPTIMRVLHLPEQYYGRFCERYFFDLEKSYPGPAINKSTPSVNAAQPVASPAPKKEIPARPAVLPPPAPVIQPSHITQSNLAARQEREAVMQRRIEEYKTLAQRRAEEQKASIQRRLEEQKAREALTKTLHSAAEVKPEIKQKPEQLHVQPETRIPAKPAAEFARPKPAPPPARHVIELNQRKIVELHEESEHLQERLTFEDEQEHLSFPSGPLSVPVTGMQEPVKVVPEVTKPVADVTREAARTVPEIRKPMLATPREPAKTVPESTNPTLAPKPQPAVQLDAEAIAKLHEASEHLRDRLMNETAEHARVSLRSMLDSSPDPAPAAAVVREARGATPEVDEDWQLILQQWQPEHWEIIVSLYQGQSDQLAVVGREVHRPISRLIDEINDPVAAQLDDYLVDPDTQTLSPHLLAIVGSLVHWYLSSIR